MAQPAWDRLPERGATGPMYALLLALNLLGYRVAKALLIPIVFYFVLTGSRSRKASKDYLTRLYRVDPSSPKPNLLQVYLHHLEFAQTLLERVLLWQGKVEGFKFSGTGKELLEQNQTTGCLLLSAHFGNFDALRILAKELKCRVNVVMYRAHAVRINTLFEKLSTDANLQVIDLKPDDMEGILRLRSCIQNGEHVALLADRLAPGSKRSVNVRFLGFESAFPESPWLLASIFGCPVICVAAARTGPRAYRIYVEEFAESVSRKPDHLKNHIQNFARYLENLCRRHPLQWFNFYDFWGGK